MKSDVFSTAAKTDIKNSGIDARTEMPSKVTATGEIKKILALFLILFKRRREK